MNVYSCLAVILCTALFVNLASLVVAADEPPSSQPYPAPTNLGSSDANGLGIQRTMALLSGSTADKRNTVRVLLYGQSITAGNWGTILETQLRKKYPHANLVYDRRPLSGYATERLVKTAEADLYPAYADLVIFHDYGGNENYLAMIRKLSEQTTSEVIIQADHLRRNEQVIDERAILDQTDHPQRIAASRNYQFLPELAKTYGYGFDGRRDLWKSYLTEHRLQPGDLLKDNVHPNDQGTYLMSELIQAYLVLREGTELDPMDCGYVSTTPVTKQMGSDPRHLKFNFTGNRVDVVFHDLATGPLEVLIDGAPPLSDPRMFFHGRNRVKWRDTMIPPGPWPAVLRVQSAAKLLPESWTLKATLVDRESGCYRFAVTGSETGSDGSGRTDQRFQSDSGRVVIDPADWDIPFSIVALRRLDELPSSFQIDWKVQVQGVDRAVPPPLEKGIERVVTLAQRVDDQRHSLELTGDISGIKALRVYCPALRLVNER